MTASGGAGVGLVAIWAIGVGAALGGDFFGWQFVVFGGLASAFIAIFIAGLFYWLYAAAITELAARYQSSGGAFDFVNRALGPKYAAVMAILGILKLVLANAANALAISSYLQTAGLSESMKEVVWITIYAFFTTIDCLGVKQSASAQVFATFLCLGILTFFCGSTSTVFSKSNLLSAGYFSEGSFGFFQGLPFALPLFDGFEEIPLLLGYAIEPEKTLPKAILLCYCTVAFFAIMVPLCGLGSSTSSSLLTSEAPLMIGIENVYGIGTKISDAMAYIVVLGLIVNFFAFTVFTSQQVQTVAESGFLPEFLSVRHSTLDSPINASITASFFGIILTAVFCYLFGEDNAQNTLVTAGLLPAVTGYFLLMECIIKIRITENSAIETFTNESRESAIKKIHDARGLLGMEPNTLRFVYGTYVIRLAQFCCVLFMIGLAVLSYSTIDYMYGIISVVILSTLLFAVMRSHYRNIELESSNAILDRQITQHSLQSILSFHGDHSEVSSSGKSESDPLLLVSSVDVDDDNDDDDDNDNDGVDRSNKNTSQTQSSFQQSLPGHTSQIVNPTATNTVSDSIKHCENYLVKFLKHQKIQSMQSIASSQNVFNALKREV